MQSSTSFKIIKTRAQQAFFLTRMTYFWEILKQRNISVAMFFKQQVCSNFSVHNYANNRILDFSEEGITNTIRIRIHLFQVKKPYTIGTYISTSK